MINELRAKVAKEIHVWPALGWYLVVTVGLLFAFSGITEWCWNIGRASDPAVALAAAREKSRALAASKKVALELNAADIERIRQQVQWPALGLVATGILGFAPLLIGVLLIPIFLFSLPHGSNAANRARPPLADGLRTPNVVVASLASPAHLSFPLAISRPILGRVSLPIGALPGGVGPWELAIIGPGCLGIPISILLILGGLRMMRLQSYPLAQCAAIAALLPCGIGWLLGLPMGIWALTLLNQPDVKAAFEACRTR